MRAAGVSLVELLFTIAIMLTITAVAIPLTSDATDSWRTSMAARYLAGRVMEARADAVTRTRRVGIRFERSSPDYVFTTYADGNGNGVRTADIRRGIDRPLSATQRLADNFPGVKFGILAGVPDIDGGAASGDPVRVGSSGILTMSPDGSSSSGTIYLHGRRRQFAVRVLGATGRSRLMWFNPGTREWELR